MSHVRYSVGWGTALRDSLKEVFQRHAESYPPPLKPIYRKRARKIQGKRP